VASNRTTLGRTSLATTRRGFSTAKLRARDSGTGAPPVVSARGYLRRSMPGIYQDGDFGLRFLGALEETLDPIVGTLDVLHRYFHSSLAPRDVLELLAAWLGLTIDESWPDERLREAIGAEGELSRRRGTKPGIELALRIAFPDLPLRVEDAGGVSWSTSPKETTRAAKPSFVVYCDTPIHETKQLAIARVIDQTKPVHVTYRLRVKAPPPKKPPAAAA
jgi:phage tail-like protein